MENFGFGALQHPGALMHSIESQEDELAYLQYPGNAPMNKFNDLGLPYTEDLTFDTLSWPYLANSTSLFDTQLMTELPSFSNEPFPTSEQQFSHLLPSELVASQCALDFAQQQRTVQTPQTLPQQDMQGALDFASNLPTATALPVSSTTTPPHVGPLDYLSPWPTPELEPTTLDEINAWMSLGNTPRTSPDSFSSSASSVATPSYHSRADSLESTAHSKPTSAHKDKPQCWEHGCNGRTFSTIGNLVRHKRERSDKRPQRKCPRCGALFSRTTARNQHLAKNACNRIRRFSNGRPRPDFTTKTTA